jgi:hypothetical protein
MAFDNEEVAIRARNLITERSPARVDLTIPHLQALIPTALETWARTIMGDANKRASLKTTVTLPIAAGVLDLTTRLDGTVMAIDINDVERTTAYADIDDVRTPLTWVKSQAQLNADRYLSTDRPAIFLDDAILRIRNTDGELDTFTDDIYLEVTKYPQVVTEIPFVLRHEFIVFLAETGVKEKITDAR